MIGFEKVQQNLEKSLAENKLHHAIVILGNKGIGKFEFAKSFAKKILGSESQGDHPDLRVIEKISGKKNISVDQVRAIANFFQNTSAASNKKVVIINKADDFNVSSSNALLKTLEEPNKNCYLILICDSASKLLPTIKSRCQIHKIADFDFEKFKEAFYKLRPDFLPKLSDEEIKKLAFLTSNSPKMAFKIGEELSALYDGLVKSINDGFLDQDFLKKTNDKSLDFANLIMIFDIFFNRLSKYECSIDEGFSDNEKNAFRNILQNKSIEDILKNYDECRFLLDKTITVHLDKKLSVINCFNLAVS